MKKLLLSIVALIMMQHIIANQMRWPTKSWTCLVYMAADNLVEDNSAMSQKQMQMIGTNNNVNILTYLSTHRRGEPKISRKQIIYNDRIIEAGSEFNLDSGNYNTLLDALSWAFEYFPSEHVMVILWDHSSGRVKRTLGSLMRPGLMFPSLSAIHYEDITKGICYDNTTGHCLNDVDIMRAFETACNQYRNGKKVDIIGCDARSMASVEVVYSLAPYAQYLVASQSMIPDQGWDYARALTPFKNGTLKPDDLVRVLVEAYRNCYERTTQEYSLSVIALERVKPLIDTINQISFMLTQALRQRRNTKIMNCIELSSDSEHCTRFEEKTYLDLYNFFDNLLMQVPNMGLTPKQTTDLKNTITRAAELINMVIVAQTRSSSLEKAHGLSIYFPQRTIDPMYATSYWSQNSLWSGMLAAYMH